MTHIRPRPARASDAPALADLHVRAWQETYPGLLPQDEIDRQTPQTRHALWAHLLQQGTVRVALLPGRGFAAMGPQRDPTRATAHPDELLALYVLRAHQGRGHGRALLDAVRGTAPFTAWVLAGNTRAEAFYRHLGGVEIDRRTDTLDGGRITEIRLGFPSPADRP